MKKILHRIGGLFLTLTALICLLFLCLLYCSPVFAEGKGYTFYLGESSSARAVASDMPVLDKLLLGNVRGESAEYEGDRYEELKARFRAELLFSEKADGVENYYLYSPVLGECVEIGGKKVNLHIAVRKESTAVGTPIIFGGY